MILLSRSLCCFPTTFCTAPAPDDEGDSALATESADSLIGAGEKGADTEGALKAEVVGWGSRPIACAGSVFVEEEEVGCPASRGNAGFEGIAGAEA